MSGIESPHRPVHPWVEEGQHRVRFGVQVPGRLAWPAFLDTVREVEALGFDGLWTMDHPLTAARDCWVTLAAAALHSSRLRLGSMTSCIYYRPSVVLARMAADVDHLSNGRLVLGLGAGDSVEEFARMGLPFPSIRQRQEGLEETVQIVRGLWGAAPFTFHGQHFQVEAALVRPTPQQPSVPVLIAGGGERVTLRQVAQYADMANFGPHAWVGSAVTIADVERKCLVLRQHCERLGRPYGAILRSHYAFVLLAKTRTELEAKLAAIPKETLDFWGTILIAGTPDEVSAYYRSLVAAGMQYFVAVLQGDVHETLELLGTRVMPEVG